MLTTSVMDAMNSSITIVTAFFDIGRGQWTADKGFSPHLERTTDRYLNYFANLAQLDNNMVVFTSSELKPKVEALRGNRPTTVIAIDVNKKFVHIKKRIARIQQDEAFRSRLETRQLINPEYWSPEYVLVCNLKAFFVKKAIDLGLAKDELVAWVDFGYCRTPETTNGIQRWSWPFDKNKMHLFTIKKGLKAKSVNSVFDYMIGNHVFVIGGALVGTKEKWQEFYTLMCRCQKLTLDNNIVDDDQGIFLMCYHFRPDLIKLNYLGKSRWFDLFKRYEKKSLKESLYRLKFLIK